ncbi:MAG: hypothetical protein RIF32_13415 [Leptospirales bacterium]|jgi:hypothetical protein
MIAPERLALDFVFGLIGIAVMLGMLGAVVLAIYALLKRVPPSDRRLASQRAARYRPRERRLVLAARANNRRPGCVLGLSLALLLGLGLSGGGLFGGWDGSDWVDRAATIVYGLVGAAALVLMLINFFKNFGFRAYDGREVQLDDQELIIDRSLIDSRTAGDDTNHPHLQPYLHKKFYYRIPLSDLSRITISRQIYNMPVYGREYPFVYIEFTAFDAAYMIQTRFIGGDGEMRFLKRLERTEKIPICVDARYADNYSYLRSARTVQLD